MSGDACKGQSIFISRCIHCHTIEKGGEHKVGPNLHGIVGKKCGEAPNFKYTDAMKRCKVTWTEENLNKCLQDPQKFIPGIGLTDHHLKREGERRDLIAFLKNPRVGGSCNVR